jgi:hypothetical protein
MLPNGIREKKQQGAEIIDDEAQPHPRDDHSRVFVIREQGQAVRRVPTSTSGLCGAAECHGGRTLYIVRILASDTAKIYGGRLQPRGKSCIGSLLSFRPVLLSGSFLAVSCHGSSSLYYGRSHLRLIFLCTVHQKPIWCECLAWLSISLCHFHLSYVNTDHYICDPGRPELL